MISILEASRWIDASLQNKMEDEVETAQKSYINTSVDAINQRILGRYQNGLGKTWDDPNHGSSLNDCVVNFPLSVGWHVAPDLLLLLGLAQESSDYHVASRSTALTCTRRRQAS